MPIISYTYTGPLSGSLVLELLAKLQDTDLAVNSRADAKPSLTVVTTNPIVGSSTSSTLESWVSCAKALSSLIPSLNFWHDGDESFEQWISSAASLLGMSKVIAALSRRGEDDRMSKYVAFFTRPFSNIFPFSF